ncbi:MAG: copper-translocating P-type ATPase [Gammaproteobacteria bacterium]|nr:copper-translocating P-type ATPase [Gammaproteobacteria bacterium]
MCTFSTIVLDINGMTCANCAALIEKCLIELSFVKKANVSLASERVVVQYISSENIVVEIISKIVEVGYDVITRDIDLMVVGSIDDDDVRLIARSIKSIIGVVNIDANILTGNISIRYVPNVCSSDEILRNFERIGFKFKAVESNNNDDVNAIRRKQLLRDKMGVISGLILAAPVVTLSMGGDGLREAIYYFVAIDFRFILAFFTTVIQFVIGWNFYVAAFKAVRNGTTNMDVLIVMGSTSAYIYSMFVTFGNINNVLPEYVYFETASVIIVFVRIGKYIEMKAKGNVSEAINKLLSYQSQDASLLVDGSVIKVPLNSVNVGDIILVKPGERIPLDGDIIDGKSTVDESLMTGESVDVVKRFGDKVYASTINRKGSFSFEVTAVGSDTVLSKIINLVERTQASKVPIQKLADKISGFFVPVVMFISLVTFVLWFFYGNSFDKALVSMVAVLVIACPCALGLATPAAIMVGVGVAAENGVLFRNSSTLETVSKVKLVMFDKTGTITYGNMSPANIEISKEYEDQWSVDELLSVVASLERNSEHPIGQALFAESTIRNLKMSNVVGFSVKPGKGVCGIVDNRQIRVGNEKIVLSSDYLPDDLKLMLNDFRISNYINVIVIIDGSVIALISMTDRIRDESVEAITCLSHLGVDTMILSGDSEGVVRYVAESIGIKEFLSGLMPIEKSESVKNMQKKYNGYVAMVGDGINDAAALAQADVGIAVGTRTDIAVESADITLMGSGIGGVVSAIELSKLVMKTIRQNLFWAFCYNVMLIPVAAFGQLNPMLAAGAMGFSSVFVLINSIRLKKTRFKVV